jgi:hypothetical protein
MRNLFYVLKNFNPSLHPRSPDGKFARSGRELFALQDSLVERQPKQMKNRAYGKALEHAGDIFRELTMHGEVAPYSKGYTDEKIRRLRSMLRDDEFMYPLSDNDIQLSGSITDGWSQISSEDVLVSNAKELAMLVLQRNKIAALKQLAKVDSLLSERYRV